MRKHTAKSAGRSRAGVIYVEQLSMLVAGLCIAALLMTLARQVLQPRYAHVLRVVSATDSCCQPTLGE